MIVVDIYLHSAVSVDRSRPLGKLTIINDGTGSATRGNYDVQAYGAGGQPGKRGRIENYPRTAVAPMNLVRRAIEAAGYTK
jgi:hypothetical protein